MKPSPHFGLAAALLALLASGCGTFRSGELPEGAPLPPGMSRSEYLRNLKRPPLAETAVARSAPLPPRYRGIKLTQLAVQPRGPAGATILDSLRLSPKPGTNFFVSLWACCDEAPATGQQYAAVIGKYSEDSPGECSWLLGLTPDLKYFMKTTATSTPVKASAAIATGLWYLVSAQWSSNGAARLYVNSNLVATGTLPLTLSNSLPLTVGDTHPINGAHSFIGGVDEVKIWRKAVSAAAVRAMYRSVPDTDLDGTIDPNDSDDNNDGIPDAWCQQFFGDRLWTNRVGDDDHDGLSNWGEYVTGSDPTDAGSLFFIEAHRAERGATNLPILCYGVAGRSYRVWSSTNLGATGSWTPVGTAQPCAQTGLFTVNVSTTNDTRRYYRVSAWLTSP